MKKVILMALVVVGVTIASCGKKCSKCTTNGTTVEFCEDTYTSEEISAAEAVCENAGGTWSN